MPRAHILSIIDAGIRAPSGDNAQPWRFEIHEDVITVYNVPERDTSLYNYQQQASYIAHGCLLENMRTRAAALGYATKINVFPDNRAVAYITCTADKISETLLNTYIESRHSNRNTYSSETLHREIVANLLSTNSSDTHVDIVQEKDACTQIAEIASVNERIVLENKELHRFLFSHITWTKKEDEKRPGFFVDTLGLAGPQKIAFKLFSYWPLLRFATRLGVSKAIAGQNALLYASGPAIAVFSSAANDKNAFLRVGMAVERFWLTAESLGLAVQPIVGLPLLYQRLVAGDVGTLSTKHQHMIRDAHARLVATSKTSLPHILFMLRVGKAGQVSARTKRLPAEVRFV